jgi:hypothetical protein
MPLRTDTKHLRKVNIHPPIFIHRLHQGAYEKQILEEWKMKKVLALVVAATMGLSSVAFAAETTAAPAAPAASSTTAAAPAAKATSTTHHKKAKHHKKAATTEQKAQAAKNTLKKRQ